MIDYRILPEHKLILIWSRGKTSARETIQQIEVLGADPEHSPDFDVITDVTELETDFSCQDIRQMVHYSEFFRQGTRQKKNAIIAPANRLFAPCRMYEQLAEGITPFQTGVFRNWASALKWMGKDPERFLTYLKAG